MSIPKKPFRGNKTHSRMPNPRFRKSHNALFQNKVAGNMLQTRHTQAEEAQETMLIRIISYFCRCNKIYTHVPVHQATPYYIYRVANNP